MGIKVGTAGTFKNSFGSEISILCRQDCVIVSCQEFREGGNGPKAELRFSYGVHPETCPALAELAEVFGGTVVEAELIDPTNLMDRMPIRQSDYGEDMISVLALNSDLMEVNLLGSYDHGERGGIRDGGSMPRIRILSSETPEVFQSFCRLMKAVAQDNVERSYPKGWMFQ